MRPSVFLALIVVFLGGCGRKACEPGASRPCECEPGVEGAQLCSADGVGWWACACSPGNGILSGEMLEVRSTCQRVGVIVDALEKHEGGCPRVADLDFNPLDAWGKEIVVVCTPDEGRTVMSSGLDGRFGSDDDLNHDTCEKIEKFGSVAEYEEAMSRIREEDLAVKDEKLREHEKEMDRMEDLVEAAKTMHEAAMAEAEEKATKRPPGKGSGSKTPGTGPGSTDYDDPLSGLYDGKKKKKK